MSEKKSYEKPVLEYCGHMTERTLGVGGSAAWDNGQQSWTKKGSG